MPPVLSTAGSASTLARSLYAAWAHGLRRDTVAARAAFDSALVLLEAALAERPEDRRVFAELGYAYAGLGRSAGPSFLTIHKLRLDPRWDPIREHPRFKALLAKYRAAGAR